VQPCAETLTVDINEVSEFVAEVLAAELPAQDIALIKQPKAGASVATTNKDAVISHPS